MRRLFALLVFLLSVSLCAADFSMYIPVATGAPGAFHRQWHTGLVITNIGADLCDYKIEYFIDGVDVYNDYFVTIPAGYTELLPDVADFGTGYIVVRGVEPFLADAYIYTESMTGGIYGQHVPMSNGTMQGRVMLQVPHRADSHVNVGITNYSDEPIKFNMWFYDWAGNEVRAEQPGVDARSLYVQNFIDSSVWFVVVEVLWERGLTRASVWASVVDDQTGDAYFVEATR